LDQLVLDMINQLAELLDTVHLIIEQMQDLIEILEEEE